ncbi:MAG: hypothetical protein RL173_689 [Fibrobacterota bacterium]|jgi:hypothetical protein
MLAAMILCVVAATGASSILPAKWRDAYVPFSVPWVDSLAADPRVVAAASTNYPTYVSVTFHPLEQDQDKFPENLWVRILDRDSITGMYLGDLVDKPVWLRSATKHGNVLFKFRSIMERRPVAVPMGRSYLAHPGMMTKFDTAFVAGVAANREVDYGRNPSALAECKQKLSLAAALADASVPRSAAYQARYLLGRCYSEGYQFESALYWYRLARKLDTASTDVVMSMMSDYSMVYAQSLVDRKIGIGVAARDSMRKLSVWVASHDTPDRKLGAMVDLIYACPDSVRIRRKEPCNTMRFKR